MAHNGGIYGDYEVVNSTRVLEKRVNALQVYNRRLFNAQGGIINYYIPMVTSGLIFILGKEYFPIGFMKKTFPLMILSGFGGFILHKVGTPYFGDYNEYRNLKNNRTKIIEDIKKAQQEDYDDRNRIYPKLEEEEVSNTEENVLEAASTEEAEKDAESEE
jgi:hypothetical protein